ncbi:hypothetical protein GLAREA_11940 [Glarea lozoyensis ATCC 20868]|uniref:Uncharacterized protein n=1 Tax=Glarea lozoyensis (strain ATCC 20868 / MF5171) TaxID=1116229 RepID=S3DZY2_GLAL2|nr:uncharacterized protein GLAREA_11940 [Glarea lozoyensis ATCC 20868]EPE31858.1 hypothetical protein GLAREA_11940 [Glarea lozoyensis ATCC 20868]
MESEKLLSRRLSTDSSFDELDIEHQVKPQRTRRSRLGRVALRLLISWLTIWSTVNVSTKLYKTFHKPQRVSCACGSSLAEARALNCRFDSLASAWLRPACIDEDLTAEFNRAGPEADGSWNYYTDSKKTGTYTLDQVAALADTGIYYYNTQAWHLAHCTYNWRKSLRTRWTGVVMEARSDTEGHVKHCEAMMKNGLPLDYVGTVSAITFDADAAGLREKMNEMHKMHEMKGMHMHSNEMHNNEMHSNEMHGTFPALLLLMNSVSKWPGAYFLFRRGSRLYSEQ